MRPIVWGVKPISARKSFSTGTQRATPPKK
jgi:hypothetical protein